VANLAKYWLLRLKNLIYNVTNTVRFATFATIVNPALRVAPAPPRIMKKLWYCDITRQSDIVKEQARSFAVSARRSVVAILAVLLLDLAGFSDC